MARTILSVVLSFSLVLAGCGVAPGTSVGTDHAFIVRADAFRVAERSLRAEGVIVDVEPLHFDAAAGLAAFATSEPGVFIHATVREGVVAAVVVMAFDGDGGFAFTDFVSGARVAGDVAALERCAASAELNSLAVSSDTALAYALLEVFAFGDVDLLDDGVRVLCAACSAEQGAVNSQRWWVALATTVYATSVASLASCGSPITPLCIAALASYTAEKSNLARELVTLGGLERALSDCWTRNRC